MTKQKQNISRLKYDSSPAVKNTLSYISTSLACKVLALFIFSITLVSMAAPSIALAEKVCVEGNCENGAGTATLGFGAQYSGDFKNGEMHGKGEYLWPENDETYINYKGDFKNNMIEGQGIMKYKQGIVYSGTFLENKRNGEGHMVWSDGRLFRGNWKNDNIFGFGIMTWADKATYVGEWKGKRDGMGVFQWPDGALYRGAWKDDKRDGEGIMGIIGQPEYKGRWAKGKLVNKTPLSSMDTRNSNLSTRDLYNIFLWEQVRQCMSHENVTASPQYGTVTYKFLNLRTAPAIGNNLIRKLNENESVMIIGKRSPWQKVIDQSCNTGWVMGTYLKTQATPPQLWTKDLTILSHYNNRGKASLANAGVTISRAPMPQAVPQTISKQVEAPVQARKAVKVVEVIDPNAPMKIKRMKVNHGKTKTEIIIGINKPILKYNAFILSKPSRVVLDIPGKWTPPPYKSKAIPSKNSWIKTIRFGSSKERLRIVNDLRIRENIKIETRVNGNELVLTIRKAPTP